MKKIDIPSLRDACFGSGRSKIDPKIDAYLMTHTFFDVNVELERKRLNFLSYQIDKVIENV